MIIFDWDQVYNPFHISKICGLLKILHWRGGCGGRLSICQPNQDIYKYWDGKRFSLGKFFPPNQYISKYQHWMAKFLDKIVYIR